MAMAHINYMQLHLTIEIFEFCAASGAINNSLHNFMDAAVGLWIVGEIVISKFQLLANLKNYTFSFHI